MVRRGRAHLQKQGGMLASLGEIDAPPPDRRKENVHSNKLERAASPPRKEKESMLYQQPLKVAASQQQKTGKLQAKAQQASTPPEALQNKANESPLQHHSPLITSPSAPLTSVKIKTFHIDQPVQRELFQSPLSTVSRSTNVSDDNDSCASKEDEEPFALETRMSNDSRSVLSDDSEEDGSASNVDESDHESLNSDCSNESRGTDEQCVNSYTNNEESIHHAYEESEDEEFSMSVESESEDDLEFDDESSVGKRDRTRNRRKTMNDERKKGTPKPQVKGKKGTRQTEESSQSSGRECSDVESGSNQHEDAGFEDEGGSFAVDEETNNTDNPAQQTSSNEPSNLASYISTLQHTQIKPSKRKTKALTKAASAKEPTHSQVMAVVDELFQMVEDKDSFTYGDFVHSIAEHFGLSKVKKVMREGIKSRLKELIRASEGGVDAVATESVGVERKNMNTKTRGGKKHRKRAERNQSTCAVNKDCEEHERGSKDPTKCTIIDPFVEHFGPNIIALVDRLFNEAESDTVFFSDIVNAVAVDFGVPKVSKDTKMLIKARFVELIEAKGRGTDPDCEDRELASPDQPFEESDSVHEIDDPLSTSYSLHSDVGTESVALNVSEDSGKLEESFEGTGTSVVAKCDDHENDAATVKENRTSNDENETPCASEEGGDLQISFNPIEASFVGNVDDKESCNDFSTGSQTPSIHKDPSAPSSLIASIDSRGHSLAGEHLKCNESFMSCETTLFKNLSPECLKSKNDESMDKLMGSLTMSDSLNSTSDIKRVKKGKWSLGNEIGSGSFGVVHVGMNAVDGSLMAIKVLRIPSKNKSAIVEELQREIDLMRSLNHPNIVRYLGAEVDTSNNVLNIFQEWVPGGSVSSMLKKFGPFSINVVKLYATQILKGLAYLHSHHIIHRDIKGGNILVSNDGCVKLADFGASKKVEAFGTDPDKVMEDLTVRGTPYFMAPEVFQEKYNAKADVWSVGGVIFQMATGSPPWKELGYKNPISLFFHLKNTDDSPKLPSSIANPLLEEMLSKCFKRDPSKRPNASTLLNDNFFRAETEMTNTLSEVSNNLPRSSPVIMSPAIDNIRHQNVTDTGLEDSLCYSLTLPGPVHFDKQLKSDVDTSDWPDWAKHSHSLSILNNSNKPKQNPFARRGSTEVNTSC